MSADAGRRWLGRLGPFVFYCLIAAACHARFVEYREPLTPIRDLDGVHKLQGIARDPSLSAMLGYFYGDDPQRVHTFRPLPAAGLWLQWHLWGELRWPYLVVQLLLFAATGLAAARLAARLGACRRAALLTGAGVAACVGVHTIAILKLIATQHDLLCVLFAILALESALAYLDDGARRAGLSAAGWMLLAFLCKEMAVALLPLAGLVVLATRTAPRERRLRLLAGALGVTLVWFGWYKLAEQNMNTGFQAHTFGGLWDLLIKRWRQSAHNAVWYVCAPLGRFIYLFRSGSGVLLLSTALFYQACATLALHLAMLWLLWRRAPRFFAITMVWRLAGLLPVLPLNSVFPWHDYMPRILDAVILVPAALLLADRVRVERRWLVALLCGRAADLFLTFLLSGAFPVPWHSPEAVLCDAVLAVTLIASRWPALSFVSVPLTEAGLSRRESCRYEDVSRVEPAPSGPGCSEGQQR